MSSMVVEGIRVQKPAGFAFFLMYLCFAGYLSITSFLLANPEMALFFEKPFVASLYLAGAADILLALVAGVILHIRFGGKLHALAREHMPILYLLALPPVFAFVAGLGVIYAWQLAMFYSEASLLFFALLALYFLKNFVFVMLGRGKEKVLHRFNNVYGPGLFAIVLAGFLMLAAMAIPAISLGEFPGIAESLGLLVFVNVIPIYYAALAYANLKQAAPAKYRAAGARVKSRIARHSLRIALFAATAFSLAMVAWGILLVLGNKFHGYSLIVLFGMVAAIAMAFTYLLRKR